MGISAVEINVLLFIQDHIRNAVLDVIMPIITNIGYKGLVPILIILFMLIVRRYRAVGLTAMAAFIGNVLVVNVILKNIVARIRPYDSYDALNLLCDKQDDFSYPSGHTAAVCCVAFVLFFCFPKKVGIPAVIVAVLVGFSRLYIGVHYPTDVLVGGLVGFLMAYLSSLYLYPRFRKLKICKKKKPKARRAAA